MNHKISINWTNYYSFLPTIEDNKSYEEWFSKVFNEYLSVYNKLLNIDGKPDKWLIDELKEKINTLTDFTSQNTKNAVKKNIFNISSRINSILASWKDNIVYDLGNNYVLKESSYVASSTNLVYIQKKYAILRKYLDDIIPKSFFIYWDSYDTIINDRNINKLKLKQKKSKIITVQRKVNWKTLASMTIDEKNDKLFLSKLKEAHKKYILLKLFIWKLNKNSSNDDKIDVKLDLWWLSTSDRIDVDNIESLKYLDSPNIMWDWKRIHFIDFDLWEWNENKETLFNTLMSDKSLNDWKNIINTF